MGKLLIIKNADFSAVAVDKVDIVTKVQINVLASPTGGGNVTGSGGYTTGDVVTITAETNIGYEFDSWNDGDTNTSREITVGTTDKTYIANFNKVEKIYMQEYADWKEAMDNRTSIQKSSLKVTTVLTFGYNPIYLNSAFTKCNGMTMFLTKGSYNFTIYKLSSEGLSIILAKTITVEDDTQILDVDFKETTFKENEYIIVGDDIGAEWLHYRRGDTDNTTNNCWPNNITEDNITINSDYYTNTIFLNWLPYYKS